MLKYILTILISLLVSVSVYAEQYIQSNNNCIKIELKNIQIYDLPTLSQDSLGYFFNFAFASIDEISPTINSKIERIDVDSIKSDLFSKFNQFNSRTEPDYTIEKCGTYRGIDLYMLKFYPAFTYKNKWQLATNAIISINFTTPIITNYSYPIRDLSGLDNIINKEHLPYLKFLADRNKIDNQSAKRNNDANAWYNPETRYYEINTKTDGIASLPIENLLKLNSELLDKDPNFLHLTFLGRPEAFYVNDTNGKLDNSDTLYFVSKRAMGDTTWFDNFSNNTTLYLSYDESNTAVRYSNPTITLPIIDTVKDVFSRIHIEKDSLYSDGIRLELTPTVSGEGWYHSNIDPIKNSILMLPVDIYPSPNSQIQAKTTFFARTVYTKGLYNHRLQASMNLLDADTTEYEYIPNDYYYENIHNINTNNMFCGINKLSYWTIGYPNNPSSDSLDQLSYDYTEISGRCLPIVRNGIADFLVNQVQNNSTLEIFPFNVPNIMAFDTLNNLIFAGTANKGFQISVNSSNIAKKTIFKFNDKFIANTDKIGYHLLQINPQSLATTYNYFQATDNDFESFISEINTISNNTNNYIVIGVNALNLTEVQLNMLESIHIDISNYNPNDCITAIKQSSSESLLTLSHNSGIANSVAFIKNENSNLYSYTVNLPAGADYHIIASENTNYETPIINNIESSNLNNLQNQYNFVVITTKLFKNSAEKYLKYRELTHPKLKIGLIYSEDIYKEFNYGRKSPNAIKDYLKYAYQNWNDRKLETMLIIGDACSDARGIFPFTTMTDFVPGYGSPISDSWYGFLDSEDDVLADIDVSRIPIKNETDMDNYLEKLESYEKSPKAPWQSSFLFMTGGTTFAERNNFLSDFTKPLIELYKSSNLCLNIDSIAKSNVGQNPNDGIRVINALNTGEIYTIFIGHGSPVVYDLDGWTPENLSNKGKYGIFHTVSCNTLAFGLPDDNSKIEKHLFTKDKGFIFCIGASATEVPFVGNMIITNSSKAITELKYRSPLKALNYAKEYVYSVTSGADREYIRSYIYHGNTLGCPLINLPIDTIPELYLLTEEFSIKGENGNYAITDADEFANVEFTARNLGTNEFNKVQVMLIDNYNNQSDTLYQEVNSICPYETINFQLPTKGKLGWHNLTIILDPNNLIMENEKNNNKLVKQFEVLRKSLQSIDPMPYHNVYTQNPKFRFINPLASDTANKISYSFELWRESKDDAPILTSSINNITVDGTVIDWNPSTTLTPNENYYIKGHFYNNKDNSVSDQIRIPFYASNNMLTDTVLFNINKLQFGQIIKNNLEYNSDNKILSYKKDSVDFALIGVNGYKQGDTIVNRGVYMTLNGNVVLSIPVDYVGFHIVHYDNEFKNMRWRHYNTWGERQDGTAYLDSGSINMVRYLRDSVKADDNIFIATMGQSFRLFSLHRKWKTEGSWDTLKTVLEGLGAKRTFDIDTMYKKDNAWGISYVFASNKSTTVPRTFESVSLSGDSAVATGTLLKHVNDAALTVNLDNIDKLKTLTLQSDNLLTKSSLNTKIYAWNANEPEKHQIADTNNCVSLDFNKLDTKYQFYKVVYQLNKTAPEPNDLSISAIKAEFLPNAEISLFKTKELNQSLLNGDDDILSYRLKNLSYRRQIDSLKIHTLVTDKTTQIDKYDSTLHSIKPNMDLTIDIPLITDNYPHAIALQTEATNLGGYDLFSFNNTLQHSQDFLIDTAKPEIFLEVDDHIIQNGEYIPYQAKFRAYIRDNSPRVITEASNLKVKINSYTATKQNTIDYQFISNPKGSEIKAELVFTTYPDTLDFNENIIRIFVEDANQNRDTAFYRLFVNRKGEIKKLSIYPNPLEVNSTIEFDYAAPKLGGYAQIEIFNYTGQIINSYSMSLNIGKNQIPIFITDQNNAQLAPGIYFYRISIQNTEIYVDPITDKFIIVR